MVRRVRLGAALLLGGALAIAWITALDLQAHVGRVVPGLALYQNAVVGSPSLSPRGAAFGVDVRIMDRVIAVESAPVTDAAGVWDAVRRAGPGARLRWQLERPDGSRYEVSVPTVLMREEDAYELLLPLLLGGLFLLGVGSIPVFVRPELSTARVFFLFSLTFVTNFCFLTFDYYYSYRFMPWSYVASFLSKATLLHFALIFPERRWPISRWPRTTLFALYGVLAALSVLWVASMWFAPWGMWWLTQLAMPTWLAGFALLTANVAYTALRSPDPIQRQRARVVFAGPALASVAWALITFTGDLWLDLGIPIRGYVLLAWALPLSLAYGMLKHNLFEFDTVVRRAITAAVFAFAGVLTFLALFALLQHAVGIGTAWAAAAVSAAILLLVIAVSAPLRHKVEQAVELALFPDYRRAADAIHLASRQLARLRDLAEVSQLLLDALRDATSCGSARLVVALPGDDVLRELSAAASAEGLAIRPSDPLAAPIRHAETLNLDERSRERSRVPAASSRALEGLGVRLLVSLPTGAKLPGAFLLGARADGRLYNSDDERLVETLAAQSVVAIENARAWEEVQRLQQRLAAEVVALRGELELHHNFRDIIGESPTLQAVLAQIEQVAPTDASVLVLGETGTGKELVVRAIHALSARGERALVKVACAAIPETLLESELFGHERGAFTGATTLQRGRFELADGGTIFFDDVDTLPLGVQAKLLRAIQEGEVQRLGSPMLRRVDVRVIAASNKDLLAEVRAGRFREDLFYRLHVVPIRLPPLRERREDIPLLVAHFIEREGAALGRSVRGVAEESLAELLRYDWPGNVRELQNVVQRALVMGRGDVLRLPGPLASIEVPSSAPSELGDTPGFAERVRAYKMRLISDALRASGGNQRRAAESLGLHRPSLTRMIRELGIASRGD